MFSVYGISGPIYRGPLETMDRVRPLMRAQAVQAVAVRAIAEQPMTAALAAPQAHPAEEAILAYREMLHSDLDRGPLYHAAQVMHAPVTSVAADDTAAHAWHVLRDSRIHQAPVLDAAGSLVGIVSERDLLTAIDIDGDLVIETLRRQVRELMSTPVVAAAPVTDIRRLAAAMLDYGVDGVPIVNDAGRLVGFVSRSDVLRAVVADPPLSLWR